MPGDFGAEVPCPKCGGEIHEKYKQFQCQKCDFAMWKTVAAACTKSRKWRNSSVRANRARLQGFRSKQGFPFAAVLKMNAEFKVEFDFGNDQNKDGEARRRWISPARNRWANARSAARRFLTPG
jgi:DNA topoisomerase III